MTNQDIYDVDITDEDLVKRRLIGLAMSCPIDNEIYTCPFKDLRVQTLSQRVKLVENLSHKERSNIYKHHRQCLAKQESE